jgi:hypothetical protein
MKNKHQQVVDLSNPNEGQYTSASTSEIKITPNMSKQTSVELLISQIIKELQSENNQYKKAIAVQAIDYQKTIDKLDAEIERLKERS